jgi:hypothetical protein
MTDEQSRENRRTPSPSNAELPPRFDDTNRVGWEQRNAPEQGWEHRDEYRERYRDGQNHPLHHGHTLHGAHAYDGMDDGRSEPRNFVGRGPKGWQRADERIHDDVSLQLERHPAIDASHIEVVVHGGEVTLSGVVSDRYTKRLAEDVSESVAGVRDVHNQIRLQRTDRSDVDRSDVDHPDPSATIDPASRVLRE